MLNRVNFGQIVARNCFSRSSVVEDGTLLHAIVEFSSDKVKLRREVCTVRLKVAAVEWLTTTREIRDYYRVGLPGSMSSRNEQSLADSSRRVFNCQIAVYQRWSASLSQSRHALVARFAAEKT
jgi:hypothetical protein